jgi:hypothetical protein
VLNRIEIFMAKMRLFICHLPASQASEHILFCLDFVRDFLIVSYYFASVILFRFTATSFLMKLKRNFRKSLFWLFVKKKT